MEFNFNTNNNSFKRLLRLHKDSKIKIINYLYTKKNLFVRIERERYEHTCPKCGKATKKIKDYYLKTIKGSVAKKII